MSSLARLAPGRILAGARWDYRIFKAIKGDNTHQSAVFMAEVLPHADVPDPPKWAMIKTVSPEDTIATENLFREYTSYRLPGVSSAACFRQIEWLDTTLGEVRYQHDMRTYALIKSFLGAALASCAVIDDQKHVNTDYKPANILLSGIETNRITAKVGDLGLVFPAGDRINAQPFAMRAPEVFLGQPCTGPSQGWAVAAMLLCWIKPNVLGNADSPHPLVDAAWCMAKIKRLFPDWELPAPDKVDGPVLQAAVNAARYISREDPPMQAILPIQEEMQKVKMPQQLRDLLGFMLATNPDKRPSASAVLESISFQEFEKVIDVFNKATSKSIDDLISDSGEGFKRLTGAIGQDVKNAAFAKVKERFESGSLFKDDDMKRMDKLVVTQVDSPQHHPC
ncbi:hypothetical protein BS50DRAFT_678881 [Corynespora cassiicola Philippines]|uniref:Protein kinase domain-containing protein n=1 Tax=Corynespora cassiicola Philippines TaxID=1448308 RepID=A0A2T2NEE5_CORCC|nr:hypothetical protein BS50DRAFT_678881 [Corynespora cassiicola Philippines]